MKKGFTILEMMIAVAIIGLLAAATFTFLDSAKVNGRDARRLSDVGEIRNGLNLYFTDKSVFPVYPSGITITGEDDFSTLLIEGEYMFDVPADPMSPVYDYVYTSNSKGTDFTITFCIEGDSVRDYSQGCGHSVNP